MADKEDNPTPADEEKAADASAPSAEKTETPAPEKAEEKKVEAPQEETPKAEAPETKEAEKPKEEKKEEQPKEAPAKAEKAVASSEKAPAPQDRKGGQGGDRSRGGWGGRDRDRQFQDEEKDQLHEKVVFINRCSKVVKGGRRFSFSALVVVGDQAGKVGYGFGKANEVAECIKKSVEVAKAQMESVRVTEAGSIPHEIYAEFGGGKVLLKPASPGTGVIAGGGVRAVCEAAGVKNVLGKSLGSNNHANVVKATLKALSLLRNKDEIMAVRGRKKTEKSI